MIGTGRTALGVLDVARPAADDVVLVTGAAGGLGALLVQGALRAGAKVLGAAGGEAKVARVRGARRAGRGLPATGLARPRVGDGGDARARRRRRGRPGARRSSCWSQAGGSCCSAGPRAAPTQLSTTEDLLARSLTASAGLGPHILRRLRELEERALAAAAAASSRRCSTTASRSTAAAEAHAALETRGTVGKVVLVR